MASGRDLSYTSSEMGGEGQRRSYVPPTRGFDTSYNNPGEYANQSQQARHDDFIDQVSTFPGQNDQEYLQQIKTDEYLSQRNNMPGQGNNSNILQQTGEGVMNAAQGAVRGAANMAHGAAAGAANIAQGAATAMKHTLGMDPNSYDDSPYSTNNTGLPTHNAAGTNYSGNFTVTSGNHAGNYNPDTDFPTYTKMD